MSHRPAPVVTTEHMQRAYAQLRRPDWPSFAEMERLANQYAIVRSRACALANGRVLPAEPTGAPSPARNVPKPADWPPAPSPRALGLTERRRRDDASAGIDLKRRASGEKDEA